MPRISVIMVALAALALLSSCGSSKNGQETARNDEGAAASVDYRDPAALLALVEGVDTTPYILVDVRTPEEFSEGRIPGAINIPYERIAEEPPTDDKGALVIVYCRSGRRSAIAADALKRAGYLSIVDFGGIDRYRGPLER
jgi:rhodanese-related sulfurtransferase